MGFIFFNALKLSESRRLAGAFSAVPLLEGGEPALEAVRKTLEYTRTLLADPVESTAS